LTNINTYTVGLYISIPSKTRPVDRDLVQQDKQYPHLTVQSM